MKKDIPSESEIAAQRKRLAEMEAQYLDDLRQKRRAARKVVDDLDAQIAAITGKPGTAGKRTRTSPAETKERITEATAKMPLTQKEISDKTSLPYGSVVQFLKRNQKEFKITGERKQKRYLWKGN
jgi:uncharacterized protein YhaN